MKYSFYQHFDGEDSTFRLYYQTNLNSIVRCIEFKSNIKQISNEPGITRLFGKEIFDIACNYFLFPLDFQNVEVGDFLLLGDNEITISFRFLDDNNVLKGNWILRRLSDGNILFWKPFPIVSVMPTSEVEMQSLDDNVIPNIEQEFSIFGVLVNDGIFEGIAAAQGIWTGRDFHTTLFTASIIESIFKQMKDNMTIQLVDQNHDFINQGSLTEVLLNTDRGIKFISVKGKVNFDVPIGSGLSIILKSTLKWDTNLNIFVLVKTEPKGVSIITEGTPACTICMIK